MELEFVINALSALFALLAGFCWLYSAVKKIKYNEPEPDESGMIAGAFVMDGGYCLESTLKFQSKWGSLAAFFASIAAIAQASSIFLQM